MSAPGAPSGSYNGYTYVVFGKRTSWGSSGNVSLALSTDPIPGNVINGIHGVRFDGVTSGDPGRVATGDVNNDGIADILIGDNDAGAAGYTYVVFGKAGSWITPNVALNIPPAANAIIDGIQGTRFDGATGGDFSGSSVATGDLNGDGIPDVIIGAPGANSWSGTVYIYNGRASGWPNLSSGAGYPLGGL